MTAKVIIDHHGSSKKMVESMLNDFIEMHFVVINDGKEKDYQLFTSDANHVREYIVQSIDRGIKPEYLKIHKVLIPSQSFDVPYFLQLTARKVGKNETKR